MDDPRRPSTSDELVRDEPRRKLGQSSSRSRSAPTLEMGAWPQGNSDHDVVRAPQATPTRPRLEFEEQLDRFVTGGRGPAPSAADVQGRHVSASACHVPAIPPPAAPAFVAAASAMPCANEVTGVPVSRSGAVVAPSPVPSSSPPQKHDASSPLFRAEALAAFQRGDKAASVLRVTSASRWMLLCALAVALLGAVTVVIVGSVEVTSVARGVLRAPGGVQPVVTQIAGTVREVSVQTGDYVKQGQVIARIDATPLSAELQEAEQRLSLLEAQRALDGEQAKKAHQEGKALIAARISLLEQRLGRQGARVERERARVRSLDSPALKGLIAEPVRDSRLEAFEQSRDESLRIRDELSVLRLQLLAEERALSQEQSMSKQQVDEGRARRDSVRTLIKQTQITASTAGKLESLRVYEGQSVQSGEWIARIVRDVKPREIVAFLPERDRAFLREGASANVEIDQLPVAEFGLVPARVSRIGGDLADSAEMLAVLGDDVAPRGPHFRVELTLVDGAQTRSALPYIRPGTLVKARVALRERRLLGLVFDPLRKWVE